MFSKCTTQINFSLCVVNKLAKVLKTPVHKASVEKCEPRSKTKSNTWPLEKWSRWKAMNVRCDRKREMLSLFTVHTIKRKQLTSCWIWLQQKRAVANSRVLTMEWHNNGGDSRTNWLPRVLPARAPWQSECVMNKVYHGCYHTRGCERNAFPRHQQHSGSSQAFHKG